MIATVNDYFAGLPAWTPPSQLTQLSEPPHKALARFIHGCSPDPAIRTAATTALVLSFWQLRGINLATRVPSLLLVRPEEAGNDPIDSLVKELVYNEEDNKPRVQKAGVFMYGSIDLARRVMASRYGLRQSIRPIPGDGPMTDLQQLEARNAEEKFHAASITAHGLGYCRPYAEAWHPDYGLLTDQDGKIILRLNSDKDRDALLNDVGNNPAKLVFPQGVGRHLFPVDKSVCLSGPVTLPQARKAIRLVNYGLPLFLLPHPGGEPLKIGNSPALQALARIWRHAAVTAVPTSPRLPASDWVSTYRNALRKRLAVLPYEHAFAIQQAIHQLDGVCDRIVSFAAWPGVPIEELGALVQDIYGQTLRGMALSAAGLSWFGLGLHLGPECELLREKAVKILKRLRSKGPMTTSELLKNFHLKKQERDPLLQRLAGENLLQVEGGEVIATTYRQFVEGLYRREEFPPVVNEWERLQAQLKAAKQDT
jgi:hypothetical protein